MKILIATAALLLTVPTLVQAGNADENSLQGQFYFFTAPIVSNTQYYFNPQASPACFGVFQPGQLPPANCTLTAVGGTNTGFGGEVLVRKGVGVGVELGYAGPDWSFSGNGAIGVGSANGSYHFFGNKSRRRIDPFATGGYSLYFGQRTTFKSGLNLGGGVNFWLIKHVALRSEIRYQGGIGTFDGFSQFTHYVAFRFGMTFR
jgi:opacity protein-like surface antigen